MAKFRLYFGFILLLFFTCSSFMLLVIASKSLDAYEEQLNKDYSIIIVASKSIDMTQLASIESAKSLTELSTEAILNQLSNDLSAANLKSLKSALPHFYSLNFKYFMSQSELEQIKTKLSNLANIDKVEIFSQTHSKIYHLLIFLRGLNFVFGFICALLCLLLFIKQIRLWAYEHSERIYILELFGANFTMRAKFLLKMIFISSLINYLILLLIFANFEQFELVKDFYTQIGASLPTFNAALTLGYISLSAFIISILALFWVLKKASK